jgi:hypothetical protein
MRRIELPSDGPLSRPPIPYEDLYEKAVEASQDLGRAIEAWDKGRLQDFLRWFEQAAQTMR